MSKIKSLEAHFPGLYSISEKKMLFPEMDEDIFRKIAIESLIKAQVETKRFQMREAAYKSGLSSKKIINIINRYNIIEPFQSKRGNDRQIYLFTWEDLSILSEIKQKLDAGYKLGQAILEIQIKRLPAETLNKFRHALSNGLMQPSSDIQQDTTVEHLADLLMHIDTHIACFFRHYQLGNNLEECGIDMDMTQTEQTELIQQKLAEAEQLIGAVLLHLLSGQVDYIEMDEAHE